MAKFLLAAQWVMQCSRAGTGPAGTTLRQWSEYVHTRGGREIDRSTTPLLKQAVRGPAPRPIRLWNGLDGIRIVAQAPLQHAHAIHHRVDARQTRQPDRNLDVAG
jgi:hypothetical protein